MSDNLELHLPDKAELRAFSFRALDGYDGEVVSGERARFDAAKSSMTEVAPRMATGSADIIADIDVCVCTFRRPHLRTTLASIARQVVDSRTTIRIIVADNDERPSAQELVETFARQNDLWLVYIHAPAGNISRARNACLAAATAPFVAFIDDDEVASPQWLASLLDTQKKTGADAVLGPVRAVYRPECPAWLKDGDFHSSLPAFRGKKITSGGTGNVLFKRASVQALRFREDLGKSGGEDTAYFHELVEAGCRIAFANEALATEEVPKERESFLWLLRRRFRFGETHGLLLLEATPNLLETRIKNIPLAACKMTLCLLMALLSLLRAQSMRFWSLRGALHAGVTYRLVSHKQKR